jgi:2'-5' RNA ligase
MAHLDTSPVVRCSVWIPVSTPALEEIERVTRLAHRRGGGPRFRPHLTLLSGAETTQADAELKLKHLAARLEPFEVKLGPVEWDSDYFRCLYVAAAASDALTASQRAAYDVFEMNPPPPFRPHVSLLYGSLGEPLQKELAKEAGGRIDVAFRVDRIELVNASPSVPVTGWRALAEKPLGKG